MLGDEGSAWWIADEAVKRTMRSNEGRDLPTSMQKDLLGFFHLTVLDDFVALFHQHHEKADVAHAAKLVSRHAQRNDLLATDIINGAVDELILLVSSVYDRLPMKGSPLVVSGGVLENDFLVRSLFFEKIAKEFPFMPVVEKNGTGLGRSMPAGLRTYWCSCIMSGAYFPFSESVSVSIPEASDTLS